MHNNRSALIPAGGKLGVTSHAFHLLQLAPGPFADMLGDCDEDSFEHLLENELYDAAAEKLTASSFLDMSVNVPDGHASVEIKSEVYDLRIEVVAKDKANAMLIALAGAHLEHRECGS